MADAAAARREARRKKILENSQNRLQFISGKPGSEEPEKSPQRIFPSIADPCDQFHLQDLPCTSSSSLVNGGVVRVPELIEFPSSEFLIDAAGDSDSSRILNELSSTPRAPPEKPSPPSLWQRLTIHRYDVVILSLLFQLIHSMAPDTIENSYLFLPLVLYVFTKYYWFPSNQKSSFANILTLLQGMSPTRVQRVLQATQVISVFSQDFCIFLFTLICVQSLIRCTKSVDS